MEQVNGEELLLWFWLAVVSVALLLIAVILSLPKNKGKK